MYIKSITYTDYNDVEKKKTVYFNLSKNELAKISLEKGGSLPERLQRMVNEKDNGGIFNTITWLIDTAYGIQSDDGEYFVKSVSELEKFKSSPVYDEVLMMLLNDENEAVKFITGIMPKELRDQIQKALLSGKIDGVAIMPMGQSNA